MELSVRSSRTWLYLFLIKFFFTPVPCGIPTDDDVTVYRKQVAEMFRHGYESYLNNAYPYDELRPLSCDGVDTWGSFSLSLVDALDTLIVIGNYSEFRRVAQKIIEIADFNVNINVSVFETNIRVVGGLLSAHLLSYKTGMTLDPMWPCKGPLLTLAEDVARRLLPAFETPTGMPYGTVNLRHGVPPGETPITCTAGVSTFIVEFGTLSRLTGEPVFEDTAMRALHALWRSKSAVGLVGNHLNVNDGKWTAVDSGIGAGVDSYFEYLVKGAVLLQKPELMKMFKAYRKAIGKYMHHDDWYMWVSMTTGHVTLPVFQSLEAFWPGVLALVGDINTAMASLYTYHQVWRKYGFTPEFFDIPHGSANSKREGYPLRPEFIESIMYLYRATRDPYLLQMGRDILESIQHSSKTPCGYATIKNVQDHRIEDRMESFFLAETTKYLYLLFDHNNFIHNNGCCGEVIKTAHGECIIGTGNYVFNTEAHPVDVGALSCCSSDRNGQLLRDFQGSMNLFSILELSPDAFFGRRKREDRYKSFKRAKTKSEDSNGTLDDSPEPLTVTIDGNETVKPTTEPEANGSDSNVTDVVTIEYSEISKLLLFGGNSSDCCGKGNNSSFTVSHEVLACPSQPFISRLLLMGELYSLT